MSRLTARLDRLERRTSSPGAPTVTVWTQAATGEDAFTSPHHPGVSLTAAELDELPGTDRPGAGLYVIVVRYDAGIGKA